MVIWVLKIFFFFFFLYSSSVYSYHLFLISSASVRSLTFCSFLCPFFHEIFHQYLSFLEEILILLFSSVSFHCSFKKACVSLLFSGTLYLVGYIFPFLLGFSLLFFPQLVVKPFQTTILPSCISLSLRWFWSSPLVQRYETLSIALQIVLTFTQLNHFCLIA